MNSLGKTVRTLREQKGMTQNELAHAVGIKQAMISHIEVGERHPSFQVALRIAAALNVSVNDLAPTETA